MAISLGGILWFETAGSDTRSAPKSDRIMTGGGSGRPVPLATPTYRIASGPQTFIGPYLGIQFGP